MARTTLVDEDEREFAASDDSAHDSMVDTQETPAKISEERARPSARALYVPSPLPMGELKQALERAAQDEALSAAPTNPPPPLTPGVPIEVAHVPAPRIDPAPPPDLEKKIDQRFASVVDSEEARANVTASANAKWAIAQPPPPVAQLDLSGSPFPAARDIAPLQPVIAKATAADAVKAPEKRSKVATALIFLFVLAAGVMGVAFALGKWTMNDVKNDLSAVREIGSHLVARVTRR